MESRRWRESSCLHQGVGPLLGGGSDAGILDDGHDLQLKEGLELEALAGALGEGK